MNFKRDQFSKKVFGGLAISQDIVVYKKQQAALLAFNLLQNFGHVAAIMGLVKIGADGAKIALT